MASKLEFVEYVTEQMRDAGSITYKRMFGEWGLYCEGKFFAVICGDQLFVKKTKEAREAWPDLKEAPPYEGASPYFLIEDVDDAEFLGSLVKETCRYLPEPKKKAKKNAKGSKTTEPGQE